MSQPGEGSQPRRASPPRAAGPKGTNHAQLLIAILLNSSGAVAIDKVADSFGMSKMQLAQTVGLGPQAFYKTDRALAAKTQFRVKEMLEIVSRVADWAGGSHHAMAWYRAQPLAAFGGRTAESLVKDGKASAVRDYLDQIAQGGFA